MGTSVCLAVNFSVSCCDDKGWVEKMLINLMRENFQSGLLKQV